MSDPAEVAAKRILNAMTACNCCPTTDEVVSAAREVLKPIRELVEQIREFGPGPSSQDWWAGVQYILDELDTLIYSSEELG